MLGLDVSALNDVQTVVQLIYASLHLILVTTGVQIFLCIYGVSVFKDNVRLSKSKSRARFMIIGLVQFVVFCVYNILTSVYIAEMLLGTASDDIPFADFFSAHVGDWCSVLSTAAGMVVTFITTGILIYRVFLVWEKNIGLVVTPSLLSLASIGLAIATLNKMRLSSTSKDEPFGVACAWVVLSVAANLLCSGLIAFRMLRLPGDRFLARFKNTRVILVESALPFSVFGIAAAVAFNPTLAAKPANIPITVIWTCFTALASQFIIFRIATGTSFTHDLEMTPPNSAKSMRPMAFSPRPYEPQSATTLGNRRSRTSLDLSA